MSSRAWLAIVAAGWLTASAGLAQETPEPLLRPQPDAETQDEEGRPPEAEQPAPEQQRTPHLIAAINRVEAAIRSLIAEEDERYRQTEEQREIDDLRAQQDMARWAFWMLVTTTFAVLLTGIGVLLIWRTLHHTRRAADFTKGMLAEAEKTTAAAMKTADAAEGQIAVSREVGEAQVRCYPAIYDVEIALDETHDTTSISPDYAPPDEMQTGVFPALWFTIKNHGQSPAYMTWSVSLKYNGTLVNGDSVQSRERQGTRKFPKPPLADAKEGVMIPAGASKPESTLVGLGLDTSEMAAASLPRGQGQLGILAVIALSYADVFGRKIVEEHAFSTSFCSYEKGTRKRMVQSQVLSFEFQEELQRRYEEQQRQEQG